jgi:hypothetical protein
MGTYLTTNQSNEVIMLCLPSTTDTGTPRLPWLLASGALLLVGLSGCGGGSGSAMTPLPTVQSCSPSTCGSTVMSLTDAAGDFLQYKVKLVSLELMKADGALVETLPVNTAVDFVQLIDLSEIISTRQIPAGEYVAAKVTVDFTGASILVDDGTATAVAVTPVDGKGAALGKLQLTVQLDSKNDLKVNSGEASRLAFDFNLLASNTVDLKAKTVTVNPVLVASVAPADQKELRVRGTLSNVDTANSDYTVAVKPFHDSNDDKLNTLTVHTISTTSFEINGTPYVGAAGLIQLAALPADTITVAFGSLQSTDQSFTALQVLAGTSVPGTGVDHIVGNVISRTGNTLTVHGAHMDGHDGSDDFVAGDTIITIAALTAVTAEGEISAAPAHTIAEISVGSRIEAFGTTSQTTATQTSPATSSLDATTGRVRLDFTRVQGLVAASGAGQLTLNVSAIDRQPVSLFNFAGTGITAPQDSNPVNYVLGTGSLDLTPFVVGQPALGIGFVASFGTAPPDFIAVTLANNVNGGNIGDDHATDMPGDTGAKLEIEWGDAGTTTPFKTLDTAHLDLDIASSSISGDHKIELDPQDIDLKTLESDPSIVADSSGITLFAIAHQQRHTIDNFNAFGDFEAKLAADLNGTVTALKLSSNGQYSAAVNTFTARSIVILLND